jgi:hypothetical protein
MKLIHEIIFLIFFVNISCHCHYEGKASESFCSARKVDYDEVPEDYKEYYSQYACCYIYLEYQGERGEGCATTHPDHIKNIIGCSSSSNTNKNTNSNSKGNDKNTTKNRTNSTLNSFNGYLIQKVYKLIILALLILY